MSVDAIAEQVTAWEHGQTVEKLSEQLVDQVRIELVHSHIGVLQRLR